MAAENPMKNAKDYFNQEDYDRLVKEGVTNFAEYSSLPVPDDPDAVVPKGTSVSASPHSSPTLSTPATPISSQKGGISRRDFFWGGIVLGAAAIGGLAYVSRKEQVITGETVAAKPTSAPNLPTPVIPTQSPVATFQTAAKPAEARPAQVPTPAPTAEVKPTPEPTKIPVSPEVIAEQQAWKKVLGADVEVKPFPSYITPEVKSELDYYGLKLMYLPKLELGTLDELQKKGTSRYLDDLQLRYPNWRHFERMSPAEKSNHDIPRNLEEAGFWLPVIDGKIEFPNLPGQWVAEEKLRKPNVGQFYEKTELSKEFDITYRGLGLARNSRIDYIFREEFKLSKKDIIRLPGVYEWNLMANREGWGSTNYWEWTSTHFRDARSWRGNEDRVFLIIGSSDAGGAAKVQWKLDIWGSLEYGSRLVIFFAP